MYLMQEFKDQVVELFNNRVSFNQELLEKEICIRVSGVRYLNKVSLFGEHTLKIIYSKIDKSSESMDDWKIVDGNISIALKNIRNKVVK